MLVGVILCNVSWEDNFDVMVGKAGSEFVTLLEDKSQDREETL